MVHLYTPALYSSFCTQNRPLVFDFHREMTQFPMRTLGKSLHFPKVNAGQEVTNSGLQFSILSYHSATNLP